jgi:hypothetical protein
MRSGRFGRLTVVDGNGILVGPVSLNVNLNGLAEEFRNVGALLEREMPASTASHRRHTIVAG